MNLAITPPSIVNTFEAMNNEFEIWYHQITKSLYFTLQYKTFTTQNVYNFHNLHDTSKSQQRGILRIKIIIAEGFFHD